MSTDKLSEQLLDIINSITLLLATRELENTDGPELDVVETIIHKVVSEAIKEIRNEFTKLPEET